MRGSLALLSLICGTVLFVGCSREPEEPAEMDAVRGSVDFDQEMVQVGRVLPGFGGLFVDDDGALNVRMVGADPALGAQELEAQKARIHKVLTSVLGADYLQQVSGPGYAQTSRPGDAGPGSLRVVDAKYDVLQLSEWRTRAEAAFTIPDVILTDLDERRNRVTVGVKSLESRDAVERALLAQKVPIDAVIIEVVKPIYYQSLRSKHRPVIGGVQIESDIAVFGFALCTMGFNVIHNDRKGFVTNSHCTEVRGESEGTDFHQPTDPLNPFADQQFVGDEHRDPPFRTTGPCPAGQECRTSDSAFVEYDEASFQGSTIARTSLWTKSLETESSFSPVGEVFFPISGVTLNKVGRTTGWTDGTLDRTCFSTRVTDAPGVTMLCQYDVLQPPGQSVISDNGDSGSPVFRIRSGNQVELYGLLWGGPEDKSRFVFSSMMFLHLELAFLEVVFPAPVGGSGGGPRPLGCEVGEKCCERDEEGNCTLCIFHSHPCP